MKPSVILLEFNELTPGLMDRFIGEGLLPGFKALRDRSIVCITDAEEEPPALEPWIQWVTVHTGLAYADHGVFDLSDGPRFKAPRIWDKVSDAGRPVWICGSMNAAVDGDRIDGLILPDPWSVGVEPMPKGYFEPYFEFVRRYVQQYSSDKSPVTQADQLRFVRFMVQNGLSVRTVISTLRQLAAERGRKNKWRRAAILDRLQWDVFRANYSRIKPALSTFFLNSTAHLQHYYWRNHDPKPFAHKPSLEHQREFAGAVRFGYQQMDAIVQECLTLAAPDTSIVLCTALSQQPLVKYETLGGKQVHKLYDAPGFLTYAGVPGPYQYVPVMAEEFQLRFATEAAAAEADARLSAVTLSDGRPVMRVRRDGAKLMTACAIIEPVAETAVVSTPFGAGDARFSQHFYPLEGLKSGGHHPDGMLWICTPEQRHAVVSRKVSLQEVAPTVLELCGVPSRGFARPAMPEVLEARRRSAAA